MDTRHCLITTGQWLGLFILVVAALPLMAVGAWVFRALLIVTMAGGLVGGCILFCVYPRFRHWAIHSVDHTPKASQ
jgi:cadmium resistance protein CadD (predicted permease)